MANGDGQSQYSDDQIRAALAFAQGQGGSSANIPQSAVDAFKSNPQFLNALNYGGTPQFTQGPTSYNQGQPAGSAGGQSVGGLMNLIQAVSGGGGGNQSQNQQQGYLQGAGSGINNPLYALNRIGAAAMDQPMVINPSPNQGAMTKGGIYSGQIQPTVYGTSAPSAPVGPYSTTPGIFAAAPTLQPTQGGAPTTPTPVYGGVTAGAGTAGTPATPQPWATAPMPQIPTAGGAQPPPAPAGALVAGLPGGPPAQDPFLVAHNSALADAGKAIYAHYGGDPNTASPGDIANFHSQLISSISPQAPGGATAAATALASGLSPRTPVKMQSGGFVGLANGGSVPDDDQPPEVRHKTLTTDKSAPPPSTQSSSSTLSPSSDSSSNPATPPTVPSGFGYGGGALPGLAPNAQANAAMQMGLNPNAGLPAGTSGYVNENYQPVGATPGTGSQMTPQAATALSGIGSALTTAAQTYAASVKPWHMQASAIPAAPTSQGPAAQFTQQPSGQGRQPQQVNPYLAAMYGSSYA